MDYKIIIPSKDRLKLITTHAIEFLIKYNLFYTKEIFIFVNIATPVWPFSLFAFFLFHPFGGMVHFTSTG